MYLHQRIKWPVDYVPRGQNAQHNRNNKLLHLFRHVVLCFTGRYRLLLIV